MSHVGREVVKKPCWLGRCLSKHPYLCGARCHWWLACGTIGPPLSWPESLQGRHGKPLSHCEDLAWLLKKKLKTASTSEKKYVQARRTVLYVSDLRFRSPFKFGISFLLSQKMCPYLASRLCRASACYYYVLGLRSSHYTLRNPTFSMQFVTVRVPCPVTYTH